MEPARSARLHGGRPRGRKSCRPARGGPTSGPTFKFERERERDSLIAIQLHGLLGRTVQDSKVQENHAWTGTLCPSTTRTTPRTLPIQHCLHCAACRRTRTFGHPSAAPRAAGRSLSPEMTHQSPLPLSSLSSRQIFAGASPAAAGSDDAEPGPAAKPAAS